MSVLISTLAFFAALQFAIGQNIRCRNEPDGVYLPDPTARNQYIWCSNGQDVVGYCPNGMEFDPFLRYCDFFDHGNQPQTIRTPALTTTTQRPRDNCFNTPDGSFRVDPSSRNRFLYCMGGTGTSGNCPENMVFEPVTSTCDHISPVQTQSPPTTRAPVITVAQTTRQTTVATTRASVTTRANLPPRTAQTTRAQQTQAPISRATRPQVQGQAQGQVTISRPIRVG